MMRRSVILVTFMPLPSLAGWRCRQHSLCWWGRGSARLPCCGWLQPTPQAASCSGVQQRSGPGQQQPLNSHNSSDSYLVVQAPPGPAPIPTNIAVMALFDSTHAWMLVLLTFLPCYIRCISQPCNGSRSLCCGNCLAAVVAANTAVALGLQCRWHLFVVAVRFSQSTRPRSRLRPSHPCKPRHRSQLSPAGGSSRHQSPVGWARTIDLVGVTIHQR